MQISIIHLLIQDSSPQLSANLAFVFPPGNPCTAKFPLAHFPRITSAFSRYYRTVLFRTALNVNIFCCVMSDGWISRSVLKHGKVLFRALRIVTLLKWIPIFISFLDCSVNLEYFGAILVFFLLDYYFYLDYHGEIVQQMLEAAKQR